jgi:hypothetical protein
MIRIAMLAALAAVLGGDAVAVPPPPEPGMEGYFANTLEIGVPAALWATRRYFERDHTYRDSGDGGETRGTWSVENGKLCTVPEKPLQPEWNRFCNLPLGPKAGDTWASTDPYTQNTVLLRLAPGRQP